MSSGPFAVDEERVARLAATRQGRVSQAGFAYQAAYMVARLAALHSGRPILGLEGTPAFLRYDWAEDVDELDGHGRTVLAQCKRVDDIGRAGSLADVLLGLAPKWLWTPEDRRAHLRFRLVCCDRRFADAGPVPLASYRPRPGASGKADVLRAALAELAKAPGADTDRALWQADAGAFGHEALLERLWERTEVLYLSAEPLAGDPAGVVLPAEREALNLLLAVGQVSHARQRDAVSALRSLVHSNAIERLQPAGDQPAPAQPRRPRVIDADAVFYALFSPSQETPGRAASFDFEVVSRHFLTEAAARPKSAYVARPPGWEDVVHGEDREIKFLEREQTGELVSLVRDELIGSLGAGKPLPVLFVLGGPGAGKTTLVRRVAARIVQEGIAVVAATKTNVDRIEDEEVGPLIESLERLSAGSLPVLLVLDDPLFAESGWPELLRKLSRSSSRIAVLAASPDYLFAEHEHALGQKHLDCKTFLIKGASPGERTALARLYGRDPSKLKDDHGDFLVLAMEASAGRSFQAIIDRIWTTLNDGEPIPASARPSDLPWPVRAYLIACCFHRAYLQCPEALMRAALERSGADKPEDFSYQLRRLKDEQGWLIFGMTEVGRTRSNVVVGATHARVAVEAWSRRPLPSLDLSEWLIPASVSEAFVGATVGSLAARLRDRNEPASAELLRKLLLAWTEAAAGDGVDIQSLCRWHAALLGGKLSAEARQLRPALLRHATRATPSSWIAAAALLQESSMERQGARLPPEVDLPRLALIADLSAAIERVEPFMSAVRHLPGVYQALLSRIFELARHPQAYMFLAAAVAANPGDSKVLEVALAWLDANPSHPSVTHVLAPLVATHAANATVVQRALAWLDANRAHPLGHVLLGPMVAMFPRNGEVIRRALAWLDANPSHGNVQHALLSLVAANPRNVEVMRKAQARIDQNPSLPGLHPLLTALVAASPQDPVVTRGALAWLDGNPSHPAQSALLAAMVASSPQEPKVVRRALAWLDENLDQSGAGELLKVLIASRTEDPEVVRRALAWLELHLKHPHVSELLMTMVAADPSNPEYARRVLAWFEANATSPQAQRLLIPMAAAGPRNPEYMARALAWLSADPTSPKQHQLLATMVAANPGDPQIVQRALAWLEANPGDANTRQLLGTLIARSDGDEDLLRRGEAYVHQGKHDLVSIMAVLLTAGKARARYLDLVFDSLPRQTVGSRFFLLKQMAKAVSHNIANALDYVASANDAQRKNTVIRHLAEKAAARPQSIPVLLQEMAARLDEPGCDTVLAALCRQEPDDAAFDAQLVERLHAPPSPQSYRFMLKTLKECASISERLLRRDDLDPTVRGDLERLDARPGALHHQFKDLSAYLAK